MTDEDRKRIELGATGAQHGQKGMLLNALCRAVLEMMEDDNGSEPQPSQLVTLAELVECGEWTEEYARMLWRQEWREDGAALIWHGQAWLSYPNISERQCLEDLAIQPNADGSLPGLKLTPEQTVLLWARGGETMVWEFACDMFYRMDADGAIKVSFGVSDEWAASESPFYNAQHYFSQPPGTHPAPGGDR